MHANLAGKTSLVMSLVCNDWIPNTERESRGAKRAESLFMQSRVSAWFPTCLSAGCLFLTLVARGSLISVSLAVVPAIPDILRKP